jgi:hypothetical protein
MNNKTKMMTLSSLQDNNSANNIASSSWCKERFMWCRVLMIIAIKMNACWNLTMGRLIQA